MLKVGLTGGIGSGKSTIADLFAAKGVSIIDADCIARALVEKNQPALITIQQAFGDSILLADGALDRRKLRAMIFAQPALKSRLEAILHPLIQIAIKTKVATLTSPYTLIVVPLLFEANMTALVDRILVIDCPEAIQIERVMSRDLQTEAQVQAIINQQIARTERCAKADDIIDNSPHPNCPLTQQIDTLHQLYLSLAVEPH